MMLVLSIGNDCNDRYSGTGTPQRRRWEGVLPTTASPHLRFGVFMPPLHQPGRSPNVNLHRDLELVEKLDRLGYDEAWIGEHHSSGVETVASPEVFIAAASQRTRHIKLATGVVSLPYHHPFLVADRIVLLDHLTRGRVIFGVGPGQLPRDARMLGLDPTKGRENMEASLDVVIRLLRGETVTASNEWFRCDGAELQFAPYSDIEVAVTGAVSPAGPRLAGRYGLSLLSLAATSPEYRPVMASHWQICEDFAAQNNTSVRREGWRLLGPMFIAETFEEAKREARYGLPWMTEHMARLVWGAQDPPDDYDKLIDGLNASGAAVIGTPEMARAQISSLLEVSGGFGCYLLQQAELARPAAQDRSYELFAEEVIPYFRGQLDSVFRQYQEIVELGHKTGDTAGIGQQAAIDRHLQEQELKAAAP
jgi:limonene 1,2-monooxygenase